MTAIDHKLRYRSAARTHVGAVRERNEDAVLDRSEIGLWAVADGAGGHQRGDYASRRIITALSEVTPPPSAALLIEDVRIRLGRVNQELRAKAADIGPRAMICSTVIVVLIADARSCCLWAGDSRYYLLRAGRLRDFVSLLNGLTPVVGKHGWKLLGSYATVVGRLNTVVDFWELPNEAAIQAALSDSEVGKIASRLGR